MNNLHDLEFGVVKQNPKIEEINHVTNDDQNLPLQLVQEEKKEFLQDEFVLDITNPNIVPGIPYYVLTGANQILIYFDIKQVGMKEVFQLQVN